MYEETYSICESVMFSICGMDYLNRTWHTGRGKEKPDIWTKNIWMHFTPTSGTHFYGNTWKQMPDAKSNSILLILDAKITPFQKFWNIPGKMLLQQIAWVLIWRVYQSVPLFLRLSTGPWTWPRLRHSCGLKSKTLSEQEVKIKPRNRTLALAKFYICNFLTFCTKLIKEPLSLSSCREYQAYGSLCKICYFWNCAR